MQPFVPDGDRDAEADVHVARGRREQWEVAFAVVPLVRIENGVPEPARAAMIPGISR